ncbi:ABC transporter ATP-binding protein [Camelimonas abortus]|uniref:ABC transporter ATP-binding protein n=1 Tax=Camelimonas abortus TaxID=1017184 RepID=A0ABV7LDB9_9HYPH
MAATVAAARASASAASGAASRPRAGGAAVTIRGLSRSFGDKQVLKRVDLHIPAGQFVAVVGKSGCGKSTLLRLVVGLDQPTSGHITLAGVDGAGDGEAGAVEGVRIMFQEPRLLPWERVRGNVEVGLSRALPRAERKAIAQRTLEAVGLGDRGGEWPAVLSGGQKQRVALARALASGPRLLALDEPLGALDALTRIDMQRLIERVWQEQGFTAILVTHDVSEAIALADRILVIDQGTIAADIPVPGARPRRRGDPELAALEGRIIDALFNDHAAGI